MIDVDAPWTADVNVEGVGSDPKVRHALGRHYVINRFLGDNIQIIDPATFQTIRQFSTGAGTNPQDIAVVSDTKAYVTAYDGTDLLIVNPTTGAITGRDRSRSLRRRRRPSRDEHDDARGQPALRAAAGGSIATTSTRRYRRRISP